MSCFADSSFSLSIFLVINYYISLYTYIFIKIVKFGFVRWLGEVCTEYVLGNNKRIYPREGNGEITRTCFHFIGNLNLY